MGKTQKAMLGASVQPKLIKELDELRGEVPRSRHVEKALNLYLEGLRANAASGTNKR
jgi:hypothetical protein